MDIKSFKVGTPKDTGFTDLHVTTTKYDPFKEWMPYCEAGMFLESFPMRTTVTVPTSKLEEACQVLKNQGYAQQE
jgi:hypothetical protein